MGAQDFSTERHVFTKVVMNVPYVPVDKVVYRERCYTTGNDRWCKLGISKCHFNVHTCRLSKVWRAGVGSVLVEFSIQWMRLYCWTGISCSSNVTNTSLFGGVKVKIDKDLCVSVAKQHVVLTGDEHLGASLRVYLGAVKCRQLRESLDGWQLPPGLPVIKWRTAF